MNQTIGILFRGCMARANVSMFKTQTRRILPSQPQPGMLVAGPDYRWVRSREDGMWRWWQLWDGGGTDVLLHGPISCRYGREGDTIYQKESFFDVRPWRHTPLFAAVVPDTIFMADHDYRRPENKVIGRHPWRPGIFMKRESSRFTATITSIRVERVSEISEEDAIAEGMLYHDGGGIGHSGWRHCTSHGVVYSTARSAFRYLWNSIRIHPRPVRSRRDEQGKRHITGYECFPWSMEDFTAAHPASAASRTWKGLPLTIHADPFVWVISYRKTES